MSEKRASKQVVVTGANGFVGQHLCRQLVDSGKEVTACIREEADASALEKLSGSIKLHRLSSLDNDTDISRVLKGADAVIHLAARVHVMHDLAADPLYEFRKVNVIPTRKLAENAVQNGVGRFIYLSSVKVNGEATGQHPFTADDAPGYIDAYGQSKWEAEEDLRMIATGTSMDWVVVRPPLVYGPRVRGNFLALMKYAAAHRFPLPLGSLQNRRSLVSVYNLSDLLCRILDHPAAANNRFVVSDPEDISTPDLLRRIANALHCPARIMRCPEILLKAAGTLFQKQSAIQRLCSSLVLDRRKIVELLGWTAPLTVDAGLVRTAEWFTESIAEAGR